MATREQKEKVGLIAGWGRYPIVVAETLRRQGYGVYCLGLKDHADPAIAKACDDFSWVGLARIGRCVRFFRRHGITNATMAGKVHKVRLYERGAWFKHLPDWRGLKTFYPHFIRTHKDRRDDTLLGAIVETFAKEGITMGPATDYAPELLIGSGQLTVRAPSTAQWKDIQFGWELAKEMGRLDIGQSVAIKDRAALAIEAIEGTDECIRRAGKLCPAGGFSVVKVAKPQQDMRFDVPTIGLGTIRVMVEAGARVLAVEAGRTIIVDQAEVLRYAEQHGLAIVSLESAQQVAAA